MRSWAHRRSANAQHHQRLPRRLCTTNYLHSRRQRKRRRERFAGRGCRSCGSELPMQDASKPPDATVREWGEGAKPSSEPPPGCSTRCASHTAGSVTATATPRATPGHQSGHSESEMVLDAVRFHGQWLEARLEGLGPKPWQPEEARATPPSHPTPTSGPKSLCGAQGRRVVDKATHCTTHRFCFAPMNFCDLRLPTRLGLLLRGERGRIPGPAHSGRPRSAMPPVPAIFLPVTAGLLRQVLRVAAGTSQTPRRRGHTFQHVAFLTLARCGTGVGQGREDMQSGRRRRCK